MRMDLSTQPRYTIGVAAKLSRCHPQTLRHYEERGLIQPARNRGNCRLYSEQDIEQLKRIHRLMDDLGVNLAAVEIILHMRAQILQLQAELAEVTPKSAPQRARRHAG